MRVPVVANTSLRANASQIASRVFSRAQTAGEPGGRALPVVDFSLVGRRSGR